jgi:choline kinase
MKRHGKPSAIILAAGVGSRLAPLTDKIPKCLVPVGGKSVLMHQLEAFRRCGLRDILVVAGYRAEQVGNALNGCGRLLVNSQFRSTNNMYSLSLAAPYVEGSCILVNGDVVFDASILDGLLKIPFPDLIAVDKEHYIAESMKVTVAGQRITHISKEISPDQAYACSIDLYRFSATTMRRLFETVDDYLNRGECNQWTEVAINDLLKEREIRPFDIGGKRWTEIDNFDDLREAEDIWCPKAS